MVKKSTSEPRLSDREFRIQAFSKWLRSEHACSSAVRFARGKTAHEAWASCATEIHQGFMAWAMFKLHKELPGYRSQCYCISCFPSGCAGIRRKIKLPLRFKFEKRPKSTSKQKAKR